MDVRSKIVDPDAKPDPAEDQAQNPELAPSSLEELRKLNDAATGEVKTQV